MSRHRSGSRITRTVAVSGVVLAVVGVASPVGVLLIAPRFTEDQLRTFGAMGDWLGGVSAPLLGLAGFLILLGAFLSQGEELKLTRQEFTAQNETFALQRFEATFFNLLRLHQEIVGQLSADAFSGGSVRGRVYFEHAYEGLVHKYANVLQEELSRGSSIKIWLKEVRGAGDAEKFFERVWPAFYEAHRAQLGHYFRNLYQVFRLIHTTEYLAADARRNYVRMARAQLSAKELVFVLYNSLREGQGYPKFRYLIDEYDVLQNLDRDLLLGMTHFDWFQANPVDRDPFVPVTVPMGLITERDSAAAIPPSKN